MIDYFPLAVSKSIERLFNEARSATREFRDAFHYPINTMVMNGDEGENPVGVIIEAALAGFSRDEIKVVVEEGNRITISVIPKVAEQKKNCSVISSNISKKHSEVSFTSILNFNSSDIKVTFENGLLHIEAPFVVEKINKAEIPIL